MAQPESKLSRAIMTVLRANGIFCFKVHGGPTMMAGLPDIIACVPVAFHDESGMFLGDRGLFVGFETKMPTGKVSLIQERVHFNIGKVSGRVFVVRSVQDAMEALESMGWEPGGTPDGV
jgi:hypothetical protein